MIAFLPTSYRRTVDISWILTKRRLVNLQAFLIILSSFHLELCAAIDTVTANQPIQEPDTLFSNGQKFKLGFFSPQNSSYHYVGIMYNVPVMTVVWVANRDRPLNDSSGAVTISEDGNLVIVDGQKDIIWSSNVPDSVANTSGQLLDTGNLILRDNSNGRILWESFQHASDSLLPKMKISTDLSTKENNSLTSWRSPSDPSYGSFFDALETIEIPEVYVRNGSYPIWRTGPWNGQIFIGIPDMDILFRNRFDLVHENPRTTYLTFSYWNESILVYIHLNSYGVLQKKIWSEEEQDWEVIWSSADSECDLYGKCGPFGICNARDTPICNCLPGFKPKHETEWGAGNWANGCTRKSTLECQRNNSVGGRAKRDGFLKLTKVKVPDHTSWFPVVEEDDCRNQCLSNCSCIAYSYCTGIGCMMWTSSLIDIQKLNMGDANLYVRVAYSELGNKKNTKVIVATAVLVVFLAIAICAYLLKKCLAKHKRSNKGKSIAPGKMEEFSGYSKGTVFRCNLSVLKIEELPLPLYSFEMLANGTNNFHPGNKLGQGGFGPVYKGKLPNGHVIAVKRLSRTSGQGGEEFLNEVQVISKLQHRNLVSLLGCCMENEEKMLVYQYMPNGSLDLYLFASEKHEFLDWSKRAVIIKGIGRGLLYLHRDSRLKIIHRDLKASNILLDEELNPKISDFGLARIFGSKEDQANTTRVVGTYGYMAPEYALEGRFSEKSDVYSFGVLLLEIVSGRRNTSFYHEEASSLLAYAWKLWNKETIADLIDPRMHDLDMEMEMVRHIHVGLLCVQESAKDRPNVSTALSMLSGEISDLQLPKRPAFTISHGSPDTEISPKDPSKGSVNDVTVTTINGR